MEATLITYGRERPHGKAASRYVLKPKIDTLKMNCCMSSGERMMVPEIAGEGNLYKPLKSGYIFKRRIRGNS